MAGTVFGAGAGWLRFAAFGLTPSFIGASPLGFAALFRGMGASGGANAVGAKRSD